jgi:hypothetical protein
VILGKVLSSGCCNANLSATKDSSASNVVFAVVVEGAAVHADARDAMSWLSSSGAWGVVVVVAALVSLLDTGLVLEMMLLNDGGEEAGGGWWLFRFASTTR